MKKNNITSTLKLNNDRDLFLRSIPVVKLIPVASPACSAMLSDKTNSLPETGNPAAQELRRRPEYVITMNKHDLVRTEKKEKISRGVFFPVGAMTIPGAPFKNLCSIMRRGDSTIRTIESLTID